MGFSRKSQVDLSLESEGKKWVIAGISIRTGLKPINTKSLEKGSEEEEETFSITPTAKESRIPEKFTPPAAPRKHRPKSRCNFNDSREFFITPPDLETVFKRHVVFDKEN